MSPGGGASAAPGATANLDFLPTTSAHRIATALDMASLWITLVVCIPSYYVAGSLVEEGMSWRQGIAVVVSAMVILLPPLLLAAEPGVRYGIPFPVLARAAFGVRGAHVASLLRALVACGWFGIETWIGGQALFLLLPASLRQSPLAAPVSWLATSPMELATFMVFWVAQLAFVWKGMRGINVLQKYSAPVLVFLSGLLLCWAYVNAGGFGPILSRPSRLSPSEFWGLFFPSLTSNIGSWAAMALSIPDFSRYARSQTDQVLGQLGLPVFLGSYAFVGLAVTSATEVIYGRPVSNPVQLLSMMDGWITKLIAVPGLALAIVTTNIPANVVAPANALVSLNSGRVSFRFGALLTALIGILFQPWKIFASADSFVYTWLVGYAAVIGPITGVLLTDYYLVRRRVLDVEELYSTSKAGKYYYTGGYNLAALAAAAIAWIPTVPGFLEKVKLAESIPRGLIFIYEVGWLFGLLSSMIIYWILSRAWKINNAHNLISSPPTSTEPLLIAPE